MVRRQAKALGALSQGILGELRGDLATVADDVVLQVVRGVPAYEDAFGGRMGDTIRAAVQVAIGGFLDLLTEGARPEELTPQAPAIDGAYQLGRGEARSGRTADALLSAYRIGARTAWQHLAARAVDQGAKPAQVASFAELIFAFIDELSAASVAGHRDESETSGRVRDQLRSRLAVQLLDGVPEPVATELAERAEWTPPETLTAVIVPDSQVGPLLQSVAPTTLRVGDLPELDAAALLLVPDMHGKRRKVLLRAVRDRGCLVGPARPWLEVRASYSRALRARALGLDGDTEQHLPVLVLTADAAALADLRAAVLAPLAELRPASSAKLQETLRAWLLHQGRRDEVAAALFVHPQTVRYRMGQLRELFGDRLDEPETVLALTLALGSGAAGASSPSLWNDGRGASQRS